LSSTSSDAASLTTTEHGSAAASADRGVGPRARGLGTALIERETVGGESAYWACAPSKSLLRPLERRAEARRTPGLREPETRCSEIVAYRELDDAAAVEGYERRGVSVRKGAAKPKRRSGSSNAGSPDRSKTSRGQVVAILSEIG
jgi:dihydrolipoamide dehydrogenase